MKLSKIISWQGSDLCCKELTLEELKQVIGTNSPQTFWLDLAFADRLPAQAVLLSTGLLAADLEPLPPSQLHELWQAVEDVNPFFLKAVQQYRDLSRRVTNSKKA